MTTTTEAPAAEAAARWPADWDRVLDTAIRSWGGEWTTVRVQHLFQARYGKGLFRAHARQCLSLRAHLGMLRLHHRPDSRYYTLRNNPGEPS